MISRFLLLLSLLVWVGSPVDAQIPGLKDSLILDSLRDLMYEQNDLEKFDSGVVYAKEVASLTYKLYGTSRKYAVSLNNLGYFFNRNFEFGKGEQYIRKAFEELGKFTGKNDSDYAAFTNNLGFLKESMGNYAAAEALYKEAASIRKIIFSDTSDEYAESLNNLGNFNLKLQNYPTARAYLEQSLSIRKNEKYNSDLYAQTLNSLAAVIQETGNYALAETKYKEALAIIDSCCGREINEYWNIYNNLASLYFNMGNFKAAENIHREVLAHLLRKFSRKIVDYAVTLGLLARDYTAAGDYDTALDSLQEASEIFLKELDNANHPDYAFNLSMIASTYEKKGVLDSAEKYYKKVLEIRRKNFTSKSPLYAETINDLGLIHLEHKEFTKAAADFKEAARIRAATLGKDHPDYAEATSNLLGMYYASQNYRQWVKALTPAIETWKNSTMHLLLSFGEREKQNYLDNHLSRKDLFLSMLWYFQKNHKTEALHASYFKMVTALQGWLLSGSQELNAIINQQKDTSLLELYNKWIVVKNQYSRAIQMNEDQQKEDHLNPIALLEKSGDLEKSIIEKLPELQKLLSNTGASPSKTAALLKPGEVFVNWVSFRYKNPENWTDSVMYAAFIISAQDKSVRFVKAFEQKQLQDLLNHYLNYSGRGVVVIPSETRKNVLVDLYKLIWQPLLPYIGHAHKVNMIPSGLLNNISFQSLEDTSHRSLLETLEVHLLNKTDELESANSFSKNNRTISLFGGADFDSSINGNKLSINTNRTFKYLEGSEGEVRQIDALFEANKWNTTLYSGIAASEDKFKSLSGNNSPEILHIATHGYYLHSNEGFDKKKLDYPLLRSGFVLSGANIYWNNDSTEINQDDDGIVTAQEISNLNFGKTKLLTLSACETALGDINNNEGVYGLQRAFKIAGVKEMLITLWQIGDKETRELMNLFYKNILDGDSNYKALRKAQLFMKGKYPDPAVWAGFELIGE